MPSGSSPTHPYQKDSRGPRIQKVLADAGVGSRRNCEMAVTDGRVTVNGHRIDGLPAWVDPAKDDIRYDGRRIRVSERDVYVMLFKPKGYVTTNSDPQGRPLAVELVQHPSHARLYSVGRLDIDGSGLLLLTNDGALANRLTHPRFEMFKGYEVTVNGRVEEEDVARLERNLFGLAGESREGGPGTRSKLVILKRDTARTLLYMELREGRNRDLRTTLAKLGHPVKKLRRVRMGPLQLKGLQAGEWRELTSKELAVLREHAFATPQERVARREEPTVVPARRADKRRSSGRRTENRNPGARTASTRAARTSKATTPVRAAPEGARAPRGGGESSRAPRAPRGGGESARAPRAPRGSSESARTPRAPRGSSESARTPRVPTRSPRSSSAGGYHDRSPSQKRSGARSAPRAATAKNSRKR